VGVTGELKTSSTAWGGFCHFSAPKIAKAARRSRIEAFVAGFIQVTGILWNGGCEVKPPVGQLALGNCGFRAGQHFLILE
jgi:hypothetical protein